MRSVHRAILLLAGRGSRLGSLTEQRPKCLLDVAGISILERTLRLLSQGGVSEAILVVGYEADQIQRVIGNRYAGLDLTYIFNEQYNETSTAYSLWLAKSYLKKDCLLLEGDILFEMEVLHRVLGCSIDRSVWAAISITPGNDEGILLRRNGVGYVIAVQLVRRAEHRPLAFGYKCAGIQLLSAVMAQSLAAKLDHAINKGQTQIFADLLLGEALTETSIKLCSLEGLRWAEVDDQEDFHRAQQLFKINDIPSVVSSRESIVGKK